MKVGNISKDFIVKAINPHNTIITGYASVFDIIDNQNDMIAKGAFEGVVASDIKLLWQHDISKPIGVIKSIYEDNHGLKIEAEINNNITQGREASELLKQKALDGLSIGFLIKDFTYNDKGIRLINKINLMEISIVTFPANENANITNIKNFSKKVMSSSLNKLGYLVQKLVNLKIKM